MTNNDFVTAKAIHSALKSWRNPSGTPEDLLASLLLVQDQQGDKADTLTTPLKRRATNEVLLEAINALGHQDSAKAQILRMRFAENASVQDVANQLNYAPDTVYRHQREAIQAITTIIKEKESARRKIKAIELETDLPPSSYSHLFGTDDVQAELRRRLLNQNEHWIMGITGLGGIGKTALADATVRQVLRDFYFSQVIWLRLEPDSGNGRYLSPDHAYNSLLSKLSRKFWPGETQLSRREQQQQLRIKLTQHPYLVVVDNLESPADTAYLVEHLHDTVNPSKFLLTSRVRPQSHAPLYLLKVKELGATDASALMRHHAQEKGVQFVQQASAADLQTIYDIVGGNPYALKLVVGLLDLWPLPDLLNSLRQGKSGSNQNLYAHIYKQAWISLSENARLLLQATLLAAETGGTAAQLQGITNLQESFWPALQELHQRSLIEVRGTLQEKRYGIHQLTRTFLCTEITGWDDDAT